MAVRWSCAAHGLVVLAVLLGCRAHLPVVAATAPDAEVAGARQFAEAVAEKLPEWDADSVAPYETAAITAVKADVVATLNEDDRDALLEDAGRLHDDWDALLALDELLKHEGVI
jgi:hypothetical protein